MTDERDTHFLGFAKLLYADLKALFSEPQYADDDPFIQTYIAQRAYDFAQHVIESSSPLHPGTDSAYVAWLKKTVETIPDIPDYTEQSTNPLL